MNIKSLLLGSAAALVAVTGARAADAVVVAEPEPVEYVRVCDTYGAGFFYIPGTETCMRISGVLRYDINWDNREDVVTIIPGIDDTPDQVIIRQTGGDEGWQKQATARVNIDVRSETEFGTFRRFIRLEGNTDSGSNGSDVSVRFAYIELGGLLVGQFDSLYDGTMVSYLDDLPGNLRTHQIRYTFNAGNGLVAALSVEEEDYNLDYTPNVVGNLRITQGWGSLSAWAAYDATAEEWAAKAIATFKASDAIGINLMATYESGLSDYSIGTPAYSGALSGWEWSVGGVVSLKATNKLTLYAGGQYFSDSHADGTDNWRVGVQADYTIVQNLMLRSHVRYNDRDFWSGEDYWDGRIRLESSF